MNLHAIMCIVNVPSYGGELCLRVSGKLSLSRTLSRRSRSSSHSSSRSFARPLGLPHGCPSSPVIKVSTPSSRSTFGGGGGVEGIWRGGDGSDCVTDDGALYTCTRVYRPLRSRSGERARARVVLNSSSRVLVLNSSSSRVPEQYRKGRQKSREKGKIE